MAGCYVFEGKEEYIKQTALENLKSSLLPQGLEELNYAMVDNAMADEIVAAAQTLPFMADKRLLVVKNLSLLTGGKAKKEEEQVEQLQQMLKNLPPTTCLVFYLQDKADGRKKLTGSLKKVATWVNFDPLKEGELIKWIGQNFKGMGKTISFEVAQELMFIVSGETAVLREEIHKIASFMGPEEEVTPRVVKEVATPSLEYTVFDMVDALVAGKEGQTFRLQKQLLQGGSDRLGILPMILRQYRILLFCAGMMGEKRSREQIRSVLGIPSFVLERTMAQARAYTIKELNKAVEACVQMEFAIKSGKIAQEGALEQLTFKLLTLKGKSA